MAHERNDAAGGLDARTNLASRREVAHDLNNWLTAKAGFLALLDDPGTPDEDETCRRNLARSRDGLASLVTDALAGGIISDRQAAVLVGDDIEAARAVVEEVRRGARHAADEAPANG